MFSYLIFHKKKSLFLKMLHYYSSSLPSLVELIIFDVAPPYEIRNVLWLFSWSSVLWLALLSTCLGNFPPRHNHKLNSVRSDINIINGVNFKLEPKSDPDNVMKRIVQKGFQTQTLQARITQEQNFFL